MEESFPHLPLRREEPVTEKRAGGRVITKAPSDPPAHGRMLRDRVQEAITETEADVGGFDERRLFRFSVNKGFDPDNLRNISPEIEFVSQEEDEVVVAFVSAAALESFEARLASLVGGEVVKYKEVLYALKGVDRWRPEDRTGWSLKREGLPEESSFMLDVELWPIEDNSRERGRLWDAFEQWLTRQGIERMDAVKQPGLSLYRIRCDHAQAKSLLQHRDVRTVDLPPRYGLSLNLLITDIQTLPEVPPPPDSAPGVVILDSGLTTGHPLLAPAVGDAQSFLPGKDASDENGHGTMMAGLALYGELEHRIESREFVPELRLFSGRILDEKNENNSSLLENHIETATRYFLENYGCKVFNLSIGDLRKPYLGGHIKGLSFVLDTLSRELDVLFIISAGNVPGNQITGLDWKEQYPQYFVTQEWKILEPAPALNGLTVGSVARYDQTFSGRRYSQDPAEIPISRTGLPSPFTRCGPSVGGAIKPDLVAYGGNWAMNTRGGVNTISKSGLGVLSTNAAYSTGRLLVEDSGTSIAAPHVAHLATSLLLENSEFERDVIRALLVAHASIPQECKELFEDKDLVRNICGYGMVNSQALSRSLENEVTMLATGRIANKRHHFYEIPIPDDFLSSGRRLRELSVGLSYTPYVRSTRITYKASRIDFKLVTSPDLDHVTTMFNKATEKGNYENIKELSTNRDVSSTVRSKGTVQSATWSFTQFTSKSRLRNQKLFVVVTRNDHPWAEHLSATDEHYALAVCFRDRTNEEARLYSQVQAQLQTRARARARA